MAKHSIEDLEISMERGEPVDDGFKYDIIAEFKKMQRSQNGLMTGVQPVMQQQEPVTQAAPVENAPVPTGASGKLYSNAVCKALAESKGTDWLLALIAFLLFCILISK